MFKVRIISTTIEKNNSTISIEEPYLNEGFLLWPSQWQLCFPFPFPHALSDTFIENEHNNGISILEEGCSRLFLIETAHNNETIELTIDAHDAFGDGTHPTTELCIYLFCKIISEYPASVRSSLRLIDVGTGSGILSILAHKCGIKNIDALDIVKTAVQCAQANALLNNCPINFYHCNVGNFTSHAPYDIALANIVYEVFVKNAHVISTLVKPGGMIIASGISSGNAQKARELFLQHRFAINEMKFWKGWTAFVCTKLIEEQI